MNMLNLIWRGSTTIQNIKSITDGRSAVEESEKLQEKLKQQETSGIFDSKIKPTEEFLNQKGKLDTGKGNYVGFTTENHRMIFDDHDGMTLTYGFSGSGKSSGASIPTIITALEQNNSLLILDVDGEIYLQTHSYAERLGYCVNLYNPSNKFNAGDSGCNPLIPIQKYLKSGNLEKAIRRARALPRMLSEPAKSEKHKDWVNNDSRDLISASSLAACDSQKIPSLSFQYDLFTQDRIAVLEWILDNTSIKYAHRIVRRFVSQLETNADKQVQWPINAAAEMLLPFEDCTALGISSSKDSGDFGSYKKRKSIGYLIVDSDDIDNDAPYVAMVLSRALDEIARANGPFETVFIFDEWASFNAIPNYIRRLQLYRKRGVKVHHYAQSNFTIDKSYGPGSAKEIERICSLTRYLSVHINDQETARVISQASGTKTVYSQSMNITKRRDTSGTISANEIKAPIYTEDDVFNLPLGEQFVKMPDIPMFKAKLPPWWEIEPWNDGRIVNLKEQSLLEKNELTMGEEEARKIFSLPDIFNHADLKRRYERLIGTKPNNKLKQAKHVLLKLID